MSQEIEIEYKILLTEEQYNNLAGALPFPKDAVSQINHYFETKNFALKDAKSALRIRKKDDNYTLTLKEPYGDHILETHDQLTEADFAAWTAGHPNETTNVGPRLKALGVNPTELIYYGSLMTERKAYLAEGLEYVLDKSTYHNQVDYELEIEANSAEIGLAAFEKILTDFSIDWQKPITKIERFFLAKNN